MKIIYPILFFLFEFNDELNGFYYFLYLGCTSYYFISLIIMNMNQSIDSQQNINNKLLNNLNNSIISITYWEILETIKFNIILPIDSNDEQLFYNYFMNEISIKLLENSKFKLYYIPKDSVSYLENRIIIEDSTLLISILRDLISIPNDSNRPYLLYIFNSDDNDGTPTRRNILVQSTLVSSKSTLNEEMSLKCTKRYEYTCLFCEDKTEDVEAAHIIPVKDYYDTLYRDRDEFLQSHGINCIHSPANLICLCKRCYLMFKIHKTICLNYIDEKFIVSVKQNAFRFKIANGIYKSMSYEVLNNKVLNFDKILPLFRPSIKAVINRYNIFLSSN